MKQLLEMYFETFGNPRLETYSEKKVGERKKMSFPSEDIKTTSNLNQENCKILAFFLYQEVRKWINLIRIKEFLSVVVTFSR